MYPQETNTNKVYGAILVVVALLAVLGLAAFYVYIKNDTAKTTEPASVVNNIPNGTASQTDTNKPSIKAPTTAEQDLSQDVLSGTEYNLRAGLDQ
ncbi:MAG TPA: hypothetical protein VHD69_02900 [Candidatus Paceibacterota bacterium]|jgi:hypothetical protein|nr:hypothetical protein [Candidatus Paceibacterota bacterium]